MIDLAKLAPAIQQIISLTNVGGTAITAAVNVVAQLKAVLEAHGYESDTSALDELLADAMRRQQIAAQEKNSTS